MAGGWVKSFQCKSRAFDDVCQKNGKGLAPTVSCRKSLQNLKDVIETTKQNKSRCSTSSLPPSSSENPSAKNSRAGPPEAASNPLAVRPRMRVSNRCSRAVDPFFPALSVLPEGHHSRNVVEIIFQTSWTQQSFSGRIEHVLKVQNGSRTVARFEEYRGVVKAKAASGGRSNGEENERCVADGNEVMRFHCMGPTSAANDGSGGGGWSFPGGKGTAICTFAGSGGAHERAGGGKGRRAMLVCRVIAGLVSNRPEVGIEYDSVRGEDGELVVLDPRAVLPCFLVIYEL